MSKDLQVDKRVFLNSTVYEYENLNLINDLKNYSLYTSIINDKFSSPTQLITDEHLNHIEFRINTRYKIAKAMIEAALSASDEIRQYLINNPINQEELKTKIVSEISDLLYPIKCSNK